MTNNNLYNLISSAISFKDSATDLGKAIFNVIVDYIPKKKSNLEICIDCGCVCPQGTSAPCFACGEPGCPCKSCENGKLDKLIEDLEEKLGKEIDKCSMCTVECPYELDPSIVCGNCGMNCPCKTCETAKNLAKLVNKIDELEDAQKKEWGK